MKCTRGARDSEEMNVKHVVIVVALIAIACASTDSLCGTKTVWQADPIPGDISRWLFQGMDVSYERRQVWITMFLNMISEIIDVAPHDAHKAAAYAIAIAQYDNIKQHSKREDIDSMLKNVFKFCFIVDEPQEPDDWIDAIMCYFSPPSTDTSYVSARKYISEQRVYAWKDYEKNMGKKLAKRARKTVDDALERIAKPEEMPMDVDLSTFVLCDPRCKDLK